MKREAHAVRHNLSQAISSSNAYTVEEVREYARGRFLRNNEEYRQTTPVCRQTCSGRWPESSRRPVRKNMTA